MPKRLVKRLLIVFVTLLILAGGAAAVAWKLMHTAPAWARHRTSNSRQIEHADDRLADAANWTADAQRRFTMPTTAAAQLPALVPLDITFSQDDLNALFDQCSEQFGLFSSGDDAAADPENAPSTGVVLEGDRLILTVVPADSGSVLSVQFHPSMSDGKLRVPEVGVQKGILPVPGALWQAWRDNIVAQLRKQLSAHAAKAAINPDGSANPALVSAQTLRFLIDLLDERPADPIVFFPYLQDFHRHFLPVRLTKIRIADHAVTLSVRPLSREEDEALIKRVRATSP